MDEVPDETAEEILEHLYRGEKIQAIKLYREYQHGSLLEAKEFIETLESKLREDTPDEFQPSTGGCAGFLLLSLVAPGLTGSLWLFFCGS